MSAHHHARTALRRGQLLQMHAGAGTTIVAAAGALRVDCAPVCVGEQMLHDRICLQEGDAHVVRRSGWLTVSAPAGSATVCVVRPEEFAARLHALLVHLAAGWRVRRAAAGGRNKV